MSPSGTKLLNDLEYVLELLSKGHADGARIALTDFLEDVRRSTLPGPVKEQIQVTAGPVCEALDDPSKALSEASKALWALHKRLREQVRAAPPVEPPAKSSPDERLSAKRPTPAAPLQHAAESMGSHGAPPSFARPRLLRWWPAAVAGVVAVACLVYFVFKPNVTSSKPPVATASDHRGAEEEARVHAKRAGDLYDKGEYDKAIEECDSAIQLSSRCALAYMNRGLAWRAKKNLDKAIQDFDEAIRLEPTYDAFFNRAIAWRRKKDSDKAIGDLTEAIRLNPTAAAYCERGRLWIRKEDYVIALGDLTEAIRLDPRLSSAYARRSECYFWKKDYENAVKDSSEAIRLGFNDEPFETWMAYYVRGASNYYQGHDDQAVRDLEEAMRLTRKHGFDPDNKVESGLRDTALKRKQKVELLKAKLQRGLSIKKVHEFSGDFDKMEKYEAGDLIADFKVKAPEPGASVVRLCSLKKDVGPYRVNLLFVFKNGDFVLESWYFR